MGDLALDTAVEGRDGRYSANLTRDWEIWGPNGGYVAAIALRAAGAHSRFDRPASLVGHFLGVGDFDRPLEIETTSLREAKRAESIRVSMTQAGQPIFDAMVWSVGDVSGLEHDYAPMPEVPDPETVPSNAERIAARGDAPSPVPVRSNFDARQPNWIDDWENRPPGDPAASGWYRFLPTSTFDDPWVDACRTVILLDTMGWPAACGQHVRPEFYAPSIDLSVGFHRRRPEEPWLFVDAFAASAAGGLIGCETRVWAKGGTLLGVGASQLLCRPGRPF
jgi:acyl-CoA thioesterase